MKNSNEFIVPRCFAPRGRNGGRLCALILSCLSLRALLNRSNSEKGLASLAGVVDNMCESAWKGFSPRPLKDYSGSVDLVVSHCEGDLHSVTDLIASHRVHKVHVYSKCTQPNLKGIPAITVVQRLQNRGRCDHTYAHHIVTKICNSPRPSAESKVVLFMKDTNRVHQQAERHSISDMVRAAAGDQGFSCGLTPLVTDKHFRYTNLSSWHDVNTLRRFSMNHYKNGIYNDSSANFRSSYINFGEWLDSIGMVFTTDPIPVCYGGVFAVKYEQFSNDVCSVLQSALRSLNRADNIEESHYMERLWAALLINADFMMHISSNIPRIARGFIHKEYYGYLGTYHGCRKVAP